jgi:mannose-6-phosphate isomerase-like protein (cupin superfamily)
MDKSPVDSDTAERLTLGTDELTVLATSAETGGAPFAVMVRMPPGGGPPVLHRHDPGEVYYVVDGQFTFYTGGPDTPAERFTAGRGQVVALAGGTAHTVRNESDADASAFVVHAPGAPMENFSRAAATLPADQPPSMEAVLAIAQRQGMSCWDPYLSLSHGQRMAHISRRSRSQISCQD